MTSNVAVDRARRHVGPAFRHATFTRTLDRGLDHWVSPAVSDVEVEAPHGA